MRAIIDATHLWRTQFYCSACDRDKKVQDTSTIEYKRSTEPASKKRRKGGYFRCVVHILTMNSSYPGCRVPDESQKNGPRGDCSAVPSQRVIVSLEQRRLTPVIMY
ncbi:hypothetical protein SCLCIDRAFT_874580 [Scleroderma citrinum Foug A]|uniref:Uncharacterized protein n=1 Tax=Scleroderma citrinum Foug A TaxID=1036808 RepID=A0A0C3A9E8_9AGAM|nr:hypothetical protein SCLCIDRAFT_874580 [Scleroderma citrinum Foug A]